MTSACVGREGRNTPGGKVWLGRGGVERSSRSNQISQRWGGRVGIDKGWQWPGDVERRRRRQQAPAVVLGRRWCRACDYWGSAFGIARLRDQWQEIRGLAWRTGRAVMQKRIFRPRSTGRGVNQGSGMGVQQRQHPSGTDRLLLAFAGRHGFLRDGRRPTVP